MLTNVVSLFPQCPLSGYLHCCLSSTYIINTTIKHLFWCGGREDKQGKFKKKIYILPIMQEKPWTSPELPFPVVLQLKWLEMFKCGMKIIFTEDKWLKVFWWILVLIWLCHDSQKIIYVQTIHLHHIFLLNCKTRQCRISGTSGAWHSGSCWVVTGRGIADCFSSSSYFRVLHPSQHLGLISQ